MGKYRKTVLNNAKRPLREMSLQAFSQPWISKFAVNLRIFLLF